MTRKVEEGRFKGIRAAVAALVAGLLVLGAGLMVLSAAGSASADHSSGHTKGQANAASHGQKKGFDNADKVKVCKYVKKPNSTEYFHHEIIVSSRATHGKTHFKDGQAGSVVVGLNDECPVREQPPTVNPPEKKPSGHKAPPKKHVVAPAPAAAPEAPAAAVVPTQVQAGLVGEQSSSPLSGLAAVMMALGLLLAAAGGWVSLGGLKRGEGKS